jgi:hypothetical protein
MAMISTIFTQLYNETQELLAKTVGFKCQLFEHHGTEHNEVKQKGLEETLSKLLKEHKELTAKVENLMEQQKNWKQLRGEEASFAGNREHLELALAELVTCGKALLEAGDALKSLFQDWGVWEGCYLSLTMNL